MSVVILSMHQDESYVLRSLRAGAKGYLLKDSLRGRHGGGDSGGGAGAGFSDPQGERMLQEDILARCGERGLEDRYELLSDREREILQ